ncbi:MAG: hypothetical protein ACE5NG_19180, partial [bacterium]
MATQKFHKFLVPQRLTSGFILLFLLFLDVDIALQQEIKNFNLKLNTPKINVNLLESKENLDASITLTQVRRGFFLDGDENDPFDIKWEPKIPCTMRYSTAPGSRVLSNYPNILQARGTGRLTLNPAKEGMRTGVYYCILVSDENPNDTSVEFTVIVQADAVPVAQKPPGHVDLRQGTPLFQWDPVEGVPYYFLFLSEGPLSIERNEEGEVTGFKGIKLTWQAITPSTFIKYGEPDPTGNFVNSFVPPLFPGIEYNWIVLNCYGPDASLVSGEVAPVAPSFFEVSRPLLPQAPDLTQPTANEAVSSDIIVFQWNPVPGVSRYRFYLYEGREFSHNDIDYVFWSQITSDTQLRLQAKGLLVRTRYH